MALRAGRSVEGLATLTGAPCQNINLEVDHNNPDRGAVTAAHDLIWVQLLSARLVIGAFRGQKPHWRFGIKKSLECAGIKKFPMALQGQKIPIVLGVQKIPMASGSKIASRNLALSPIEKTSKTFLLIHTKNCNL